jgi:hypothetical protein
MELLRKSGGRIKIDLESAVLAKFVQRFGYATPENPMN